MLKPELSSHALAHCPRSWGMEPKERVTFTPEAREDVIISEQRPQLYLEPDQGFQEAEQKADKTPQGL